MCNKTTSLNLKKPSCMIKKESTLTLKLARKTRSKIRKPKFLSLRLELFPENNQQSGEMTTTTTTHHHQLNLFPLHPEKIMEEKDTNDENVANFFSAADGAATTLTDLLCATSDEGDAKSPSSLTYTYGEQEREEGALVRTALRNKERDASEETWVCYSEVVERKDEEVSSSAAELRYKNKMQRLSLKLDYEEIMNAWSDKGPLYLHVECPQTVPDLHHDDFLANATTNGLKHGWESNGGLWRVPEMSGSNSSSGSIKMMKEEEVQIGGEDGKMIARQREASVLRYKEKRQNRLFSKKIRYEVRKLNAEKRPRIKGRFVKRS